VAAAAWVVKLFKIIDITYIIMYDNTMRSTLTISRQLRDRRQQLGLSLTQLARRADTSAPTLSRYENGWSRFEVATLQKLATALGCELVVRLEPRESQHGRPTSAEVVKQLSRLFWDTRLEASHLAEHAIWVIERVLEFGGLDDVRILIAHLGRAEFFRLAGGARLESARTRRFWQQMLEKEGAPCTRKFSREEAASSWRSSSR
jgi:transcriptional regulator with XRE-family HTH domain